jgi:hypothetical protein
MSKLSKKLKRRVELYMDMLDFNGDIISFIGEEQTLKHKDILVTIYKKGCYNKTIDKKTLTLMEKLYHHHKVILS